MFKHPLPWNPLSSPLNRVRHPAGMCRTWRKVGRISRRQIFRFDVPDVQVLANATSVSRPPPHFVGPGRGGNSQARSSTFDLQSLLKSCGDLQRSAKATKPHEDCAESIKSWLMNSLSGRARKRSLWISAYGQSTDEESGFPGFDQVGFVMFETPRPTG